MIAWFPFCWINKHVSTSFLSIDNLVVGLIFNCPLWIVVLFGTFILKQIGHSTPQVDDNTDSYCLKYKQAGKDNIQGSVCWSWGIWKAIFLEFIIFLKHREHITITFVVTNTKSKATLMILKYRLHQQDILYDVHV